MDTLACDVLREGIANDNLPHSDDVLMIRDHESLNFSQTGDGKPILLLVHLELLQRNDRTSRLATRSKDDTVGTFFDMI